MNNAFTVGGVHGARQVGDQSSRLQGWQGDAAQTLRERPAVDIFQRKERPTGGLANFVDLDDVGVLKTGDDFRFGQEAGVFLWPNLRPAKDHLEGAVSYTHLTLPTISS